MSKGQMGAWFTPYSLRDVIKRRLEDQGITPYRLAKRLSGIVPQRSIYHFLEGGDIKSSHLDAILNALFIRFTYAAMMGRRGRNARQWVAREWDREVADALGLNRYYDRHLDGTSQAVKEIRAKRG